MPYLSRGWKAEQDGLIDAGRGGHSCEIVSPVLRGAEGLAQVAEVVRTLEAKGHKVNITWSVHVGGGQRRPRMQRTIRVPAAPPGKQID